MSRLVSIAVALALALTPLPALAGASENAFLGRLVGIWNGKGTLTGDETGELSCRATIRQRSEGINFSVKCDVPEFGAQNFSGIVSYNDAAGRYEATSPGGEVTVGTKSGNAVVFNAKLKGIAIGTSVMKLTPSRIVVDTNVKRPGSSAEIKSHLELTK
ncbi:MAG: hypothetical protein J0I48_02120 [Devosia sp.]|uniref:hypothetical protein n=1 Tax=Devosia sp. 66-22 TaxID=1895753 RepID=UPI00092747F2|nr:hypothetical protein [Devosia sp. 66-22]MBN9344986.1 hypothetical protein [Devosia sp.]OJX48723.1 MAG: hypothetical protein BGO81_18785 [Devosia sp. 66-22]